MYNLNLYPFVNCVLKDLQKKLYFFKNCFVQCKIALYLRTVKGALAQLVEQWTENPCVPSSILGGTTLKTPCFLAWGFLFFVTMTTLFSLTNHIVK